MNAKELASLTGLSERTIRNMINRGDLNAEKKGKEFEIDERQALKLIYTRRMKYEMLAKKGEIETKIILPIRLEKAEVFEKITDKFENILNIDDKYERMKAFECSKVLNDINKFIELSKKIESYEKAMAPVYKNLDKDIDNEIEKILNETYK